MLNSKVITILSSFNKGDLNQFRKYLLSPFFNENEGLIHLFDLLLPVILGKNKQLQKELLWKQLFGKTPYHDIQFRRLMSDLNKHAQQFLAYRHFEKDSFNVQMRLLDGLQEPKLEKHFNATIRSIGQTLDKKDIRDSSYHEYKFHFEYHQHKYLEKSKIKKNDFSNLEKADHHLNCFYISQKLKHYCDLLGYQRFLSRDSHIELLPSFIEYVGQSDYLKEPAVQAYYTICMMYRFPEEESYFQHLKQYLENNLQHFPREEQKTLYIFAMNYCIYLQIHNGKRKYLGELFQLYHKVLDEELIFEKGYLDPNHYKNIISAGLQTREFDWVENFIQVYTDRLAEKHQDNALNYNLANLYFHKKEYSKVIEQLREVEYTNLSYALGGKLILLRTYYELGEFNALDSLIDSFRIYLRRNKLISKDVQQQYLNALRFTKKLISIPTYDKASLQKISMQIEQSKAVAAKRWLLDKIAAAL
ncbi:MAG: hypothetical protein AAF990_06390 [Bacteroidota bacterium]